MPCFHYYYRCNPKKLWQIVSNVATVKSQERSNIDENINCSFWENKHLYPVSNRCVKHKDQNWTEKQLNVKTKHLSGEESLIIHILICHLIGQSEWKQKNFDIQNNYNYFGFDEKWENPDILYSNVGFNERIEV